MSKTDIWMPLYIGDYLRDTGRLNTEQHGAYFLMLLDYWNNQGPLPDDDEQLGNITKLGVARFKKMRPVLAQFFTIKDGLWYQKRVEEEIAKANSNSEKRRNAANARWGKPSKPDANAYPSASAKHVQSGMQTESKTDASVDAKAMQTVCPSPSPSPSPSDNNSLSGAGEDAIAHGAVEVEAIPSVEEVIAMGSMAASIPEDYCRHFHHQQEVYRRWFKNSRLIPWRKDIIAWWSGDKANWERRKARMQGQSEGQGTTAPGESVWAMTKRIEFIDKLTAQIRKRGTDVGDSWTFANENDAKDWKELRAEKKALEEKIAKGGKDKQ